MIGSSIQDEVLGHPSDSISAKSAPQVDNPCHPRYYSPKRPATELNIARIQRQINRLLDPVGQAITWM